MLLLDRVDAQADFESSLYVYANWIPAKCKVSLLHYQAFILERSAFSSRSTLFGYVQFVGSRRNSVKESQMDA